MLADPSAVADDSPAWGASTAAAPDSCADLYLKSSNGDESAHEDLCAPAFAHRAASLLIHGRSLRAAIVSAVQPDVYAAVVIALPARP